MEPVAALTLRRLELHACSLQGLANLIPLTALRQLAWLTVVHGNFLSQLVRLHNKVRALPGSGPVNECGKEHCLMYGHFA